MPALRASRSLAGVPVTATDARHRATATNAEKKRAPEGARLSCFTG
jgi:hypothetical protein